LIHAKSHLLSSATQLIDKHTAPAARCVYSQPAALAAQQVVKLFLLNDLGQQK
jgi:hypothetical protein